MIIKKTKNNSNASNKSNTKYKLANALEVPRDVACSDSIITLTGKREILIENYKGIVEYDQEVVKIKTKNGIIELNGKNFFITYLTDEEIKVTGRIKNISY